VCNRPYPHGLAQDSCEPRRDLAGAASGREDRHWRGASPTTALTHIAVQEQLDGKAAEWLEHVTDDQYGAR
jgi:hypothetical protein